MLNSCTSGEVGGHIKVVENDLNDKKSLDGYFEDIFSKLAIEHNLKEASFKHQLDLNKIITQDSPY